EDLVLNTSMMLSDSALQLLRVLSVAARPLPPRIALQASGVAREQRARVHELQTLRLVRTRHISGERLLDTYHDRVRTSIEGALGDVERQRIHHTLLQLLIAEGSSDAAWLHELALGAGQPALASHYGLLAADAASANLAFERAAQLYERCLRHVANHTERSLLLRKLASAHVRCRRGKQAAAAYLEASKLVQGQDRIELLRLAASHLLRSGSFEEGERVVQQVLEGMHIDVPRSELGLYAAIGWERARIAVLQRTVKPRDGVTLPAAELSLGTLYAMLALDTQCHMPLRAALFQMRATRICFQYGERQTTARAYCLNAALATFSANSEHVDEMLARAEALIDVRNDPETLLELYAARAVCAANLGREAEMIAPARAAEALYETNSAGGELGDYFYMFVVRAMLCSALQFLGRHNEASAEVQRLLADAAATDNRCAVLMATMVRTGHEQVDNGCRGSRARLDAERAELPTEHLTPLHLLQTMAALRAACHTGEHDWALQIYADFEPKFESSPLKRSVYLVYLLRIHHARLVLNRHVALAHTSDPERVFRSDLRWLKKYAPVELYKPAELRMLSRAAAIRGERARAAELFEQSRLAHSALGAADDVERDRYALGLLQGGEQGAQLISQAVAALKSLGVRDPALEIRGFFPELLR
ncbi:MAG TPA: hypothetical protein VMF89_26455, partial [Polyangiales bacterium]|nr:hypothetical protein [Polyangiales bacterium]